MNYRLIKTGLLALLAGCLSIACSKDDDPETRSFHMGFTPFPYENSLEAVNYVYDRLETDSDIINHHFDNGVPWNEALNNTPFHANIISWATGSSEKAGHLKVTKFICL
jgi:hypothetical protein